MKTAIQSQSTYRRDTGKVGKGILLWLLGVPLPILLILWILTSC